jgi:hypothetical protein
MLVVPAPAVKPRGGPPDARHLHGIQTGLPLLGRLKCQGNGYRKGVR